MSKSVLPCRPVLSVETSGQVLPQVSLLVNSCVYLSAHMTGLHGITFLDIYTKVTSMHGGTSIDISTGKTVVCGITCAYDEYRIHGPKQASIEPGSNHIGADAVVKLLKGVSYSDTSFFIKGNETVVIILNLSTLLILMIATG